MNTRLRQLGGIVVEHLNGHDYGAADWQHTPRVVQHTTESGFESALAKLTVIDSPTFLAGRDKTGRLRCVQLLDIGRAGGALEHPPGTGATNGACAAQIELVGYSQRARWLPDPGVAELLAHLYAALHDETGVPLKHISNPTRDRAKFARNAGFYGHADIPDQPAGHWDPGALDYVTLFRAARAELTQPGWYVAAKTLSPLWAWIAWRDHGAPEALRPAQIPARVPRAWWLRYATHRGV